MSAPLWLHRVNSAMPVTVAALYIERFQVKGIPAAGEGGGGGGRLGL